MRDKIKELPNMITLALGDKPPKALAHELKCSLSVIYQSMRGTKAIPAAAMRQFAQCNLIAMSSMALQSTGLSKLFRYRRADRHVLARILDLKMHDAKSDEYMNKLAERLYNKNTPEQLTDEDKKFIYEAAGVMVERDNVALNLLMEIESRYGLNIVEYLQSKSPRASTREL